MKKPIFTGACTALITPFKNGTVDYDAFGKLIDWQIEEGIDALLIAGTSGEGSTLSDEEHRDVLKFAYDRAAGRVPMIAGTGSNDTAYAIDLTKFACEVGYDANLVVTPYYNKATQNGLVKMYQAIADASTKPLVLYNVPSRTGVNIKPETFKKLEGYPHIDAIKDAGGNISESADTAMLVGDSMTIYSGNDDQIIPIMSLGGMGVISVLSNVMPKETSQMCHMFLDGDLAGARAMQLKLLPLIHALFSEVNPIPVKAACALMGLCENEVRLPLTVMEEKNMAVLKEEMIKAGIAVKG